MEFETIGFDNLEFKMSDSYSEDYSDSKEYPATLQALKFKTKHVQTRQMMKNCINLSDKTTPDNINKIEMKAAIKTTHSYINVFCGF